MTREKMCELAVILASLEQTIQDMTDKKPWLSVYEVAQKLKMSAGAVSTYKDRIAFKDYVKFSTDGCRIKNCPEALKLLQSYKYRDFEYEQQLLEKKASE